MRFAHSLRRATALALASVLVLPSPSAGASDDWARVRQLKPGTAVWVRLNSGELLSGSITQVGSENLFLETQDGDEMIARRVIREVSIARTGVPWYSLPLVAGAVGVGLAGSYGMGRWLWHECGSSGNGCDEEGIEFGITIVIAAPVVTGLLAYRGLRRETSKVVYRAPDAEQRGPILQMDDAVWASICRALPASLACPSRAQPGWPLASTDPSRAGLAGQ